MLDQNRTIQTYLRFLDDLNDSLELDGVAKAGDLEIYLNCGRMLVVKIAGIVERESVVLRLIDGGVAKIGNRRG